ncbi:MULTISPECIES: DUF2388 domain-containing protein [Luteimonas]|uniref:Holliday junction resolvase n=1 Tax=Luteimonas chenhongjianii TaxID=2006110 RepID=A0A290XEC0_9GAMM|nr:MULTISPECIES: DUF2388 domain-containing protein [Luteimonas]ATD67492.1 hypothetical protein CNR27_08620 [Luteimonas chenhongjianii]RPD85933.1 DUF2388 domain-containing protein [Luteimonas sp. 100069]
MKVRSAFLLLAALSAPAFAGSFAGTSAGATSGGASASSGSTSGNDKVVLQAREDAAGFVASEGRIRGARLEAALRHLRETRPLAREASDLELAQAILAR